MRLVHGLVALPLLVAACQRDAGTNSSESSITDTNAPTLSAAVTVAGASGPSMFSQTDVVVASDGHDFLAAWTEHGPSGSIVRAGRIDAKGAVLDDRSLSLTVGAADGEDLEPSVAFDGSSYLVAWTHHVNHDNYSPGYIAAVRVSPEGKVLDAKPLELGSASNPSHVHSPQVTANGTSWLVVWDDTRSANEAPKTKNDLYLARIDAKGTPIGDATGTRITRTGSDERRSIAMASAGATSLVVWNELQAPGSYDLYGLRIGADGTPLDAAPVTLATAFEEEYPMVAANADSFLVGWSMYDQQIGQSGAQVQLIGADGKLIGDTVHDVTPMNAGPAAVTWDGTAWTIASKKSVRRLGTDRKLSKEIPATVGRTGPAVALASGNGQTLFLSGEHVWSDLYASGATPLAATLYGSDGAVVRDAIRPARASSVPRNVVAATNGSEQLVVWSEYRKDWAHPELRAALRKADGTVGESILVRGGDRAALQPKVVFDGTDYVVAWVEGTYEMMSESSGTIHSNVAGVRISAKGELEGEPVVTTGNSSQVELAVVDNDVVALVDGYRGVRFPEGLGDLQNPLYSFPSEPSFAASSRILTSDGKSFVVVWYGRKASGADIEIHAQQFTASGTTSPVRVVGTYSASYGPAHLAAAGDGAGHTLVAWDDPYGNSGLAGVLFDAKNVIATGALVPPTNGSTANAPLAPSIAFDGLQWLVAFEEGLHSAATDSAAGISLVRVRNTPDGFQMLDEKLSISATAARSPEVAANDKGQAVIAYIADAQPTLRGLTDVAGPPLPPAPKPSTPPSTTSDDDDDVPAPAPPSKTSGGKSTKTPSPSGTEPAQSSDRETTTESPPPAAPTTITKESGGCSSAPSGSSSNAGAVFLVAVAWLAASRRRRARA